MKIFSYLGLFCCSFALAAAEPTVARETIEVDAKAQIERTDADKRTESNIAKFAARLLERTHYSQQQLDDEVSGKWLDRYIDSLDRLHLYFLESDVGEFEKYRTELDNLTLESGDTRPAHLIFARMMERVEQRHAYVNELLKTEKFEFTGNDRYTPDRRELPRAKTLDEARQLWRQHLRSEFLHEKLAAKDTNKVKTAKLENGDPKGKVSLEKTKVTDGITNTTSAKATNATPTEKIIEEIQKRYTNIERNLKELSGDDVFEIYITALARVYDPHSDYMGRSQFENFNISMKLSLFGIGALLESKDGYCTIKELMAGPAMQSKKIKPGDRIVAVAQGDGEFVDVVGKKLNRVVELIRGEKGTEVRLRIWPAAAADSSERKTVAIVRDIIKLEDQEAKAKVIEVPNGKETVRLGVIDLPSFYADPDPRDGSKPKFTTEDIAKLLKKLNQEKVAGVILDLRRNGGGLLDEAVNLTGLFITNGPVVQVKNLDGEIITLSDSDKSVAYKGPLIVLTSRFSASASEILAGALQDYGRALVIGDSSTFGKGTVQRLIELNDHMQRQKLEYSYHPGALKPTTAKFYRAGGSSTQLRGVIPDLRLPTVIDYAEIGEASMENPLPFDEVSSASFEKWNLVKPYLPELQTRSDQRIKTDQDFVYIQEDIKEFKKNLADKSISLNEQTRRKEKKEIEAREEARKKERKGRTTPEPKVFEVTLKNAELPGLQLYVPKTNELAAAESGTTSLGLDEDGEPEDKNPAVDAPLRETEKILLDYISLLTKEKPALSKAR